MELGHLKYFYEVARAGSFTAASKTLHVSQPALSKTVAFLEAAHGVKLMERSKKGVALTALGTEVYLECEKIFSSVQEVKNRFQQSKASCEGYLRFGASDHIANYFLVNKVVDIQRQHPKLTPSVFVGAPNDIVQMLLKKELEFGLFFTKVEHDNIVYQPLVAVPLVAVYHPKFNLGFKKTPRKNALPEAYIGSIAQDYKVKPAQDVLDLLQKAPETHFESNSQEMQKRLCLAGAGLAILAKFMVEDELNRNILSELPLPQKKQSQILIAKRKNHTYSLGAKKFLELLKGA